MAVKKRVERLRGMYDLLPGAYRQQQQVLERSQALLGRAGYVPVDAPVLERSDLFLSSFGQESWQNLYAFRLHHRDLCLRPEYTASICRLYLDHYQQQGLPLRFQYAGPVFRYEAPGRGRYRQHTQLGVELFGGHPAYADAEMLQLACDVLRDLHIEQYRLELGHIGVASGFIQRLHLDEHAAHLLLSLMEQISRSPQGEAAAQARLEALYPIAISEREQVSGPFAPLACKQDVEILPMEQAHLVASLLGGMHISLGDDETRHEVVERFLWKMGRGEQRRQILHALEFLRALHAIAGPPPAVFDEVRALLGRYELDAAPLLELEHLVDILNQGGVPNERIILNLALGRGVSYYTGLVFEIHGQDEDGLDAQVCGGGRYDHLVRAVGGPRDIRACGFAFGVERLLALLPAHILPIATSATQALVIPVSREDVPYALSVARTIRQRGGQVEVDVTGHGVGAGLKLASKREITLALIVGENERSAGKAMVHELATGLERTVSIDTSIGAMFTAEEWR